MKDAVAVVIKKNDRFLLIKRAKKGEAEDYWCPITGAVEDGETQEEAVIREAKEEMGIVVRPIKKIWECFTADKKYRLHWWWVKLLNDKIRVCPDEVKDFRWLTLAQMQKIDKMFADDLLFFKSIGQNLSDRLLD
jgi:8-oxo-dGTP diphosphatase